MKYAITLILAGALAGCVSTKAAYNEAENLRETAYVLTEHYAAVIHEAADLGAQPSTPETVRQALKASANATAKFVKGDENAVPPVPSLLDLVNNYEALGSAASREELQAAIRNAVHAMDGFIKELRLAQVSLRGSTRGVPSGNATSDRIMAWAGGDI